MTFLQEFFDLVVAQFNYIAEQGGPVALLLVGLSFVALALIVAKLWQFLRLGVGRHAALSESLDLWDRGARAQAIRKAGSAPSHLALLTVQAMQADTEGDDPGLRARLTGIAESRIADVSSGLRLLDTIAQVAPLLGLFGTVVGMIDAFQALQSAGSSVNPADLAGGIWVALLTTALGLAVSMPATLVLALFDGRIAKETQLAGRIIDTVLYAGLGNGTRHGTETQDVEALGTEAAARQRSHA